MRPAHLIVGFLALAGCELAPVGDKPDPITLMSPGDLAYYVATPDSYCIDRPASREGRDFYVMAGCALVSNQEVMPFRDGLITVQFGAEQTASVAGSEDALLDLLTTTSGVALLSEEGDASDITVDALDSQTNLVIVHFTDTAPPPFVGLEQSEWRAFLDIGGRLATVTVRGFARSPLSREDGEALLLQAVAALRAANPPAAAASAAKARAKTAAERAAALRG